MSIHVCALCIFFFSFVTAWFSSREKRYASLNYVCMISQKNFEFWLFKYQFCYWVFVKLSLKEKNIFVITLFSIFIHTLTHVLRNKPINRSIFVRPFCKSLCYTGWKAIIMWRALQYEITFIVFPIKGIWKWSVIMKEETYREIKRHIHKFTVL